MKASITQREWRVRFEFEVGEIEDQISESLATWRPDSAVVTVAHTPHLDRGGSPSIVSSVTLFGHAIRKDGSPGRFVHETLDTVKGRWVTKIIREAEQLARTELGL